MENNIENKKKFPSDGLLGLKEYFKEDFKSGFVICMLALPLSLGIAKASGFPALMGLVTAIVGGVIVSFFAGSRLTIKGPAAGLISIVSGAVVDFGGDETGWHMACGAIFVAGIIQILFGVFKFGKLVDFFPLSAIHGMLAAIGIIIITKQIPVLLNINPTETKGVSIFGLMAKIPHFISNLDPMVTTIGLISLGVMLGWRYLKHPIAKAIPAPFIVLLIAIPYGLYYNFKVTETPYTLVKVGNILDTININLNFNGFAQPGIFIKYVIMFAMVGSIESLLTVKAIDLLDVHLRKSNTNKDIIAVGIGNCISSLLGGLAMISEVARSSANVSNGAVTRWANFYHGLFILIFSLFAVSVIELIPNAALAAMLISVGIKLAHPKEFIHTFQIGKEQLAVFLITIFFTLYEDLLVGVGAGILLQFIINLYYQIPFSSLFKAPVSISFIGNDYLVEIDQAAIFTNYLSIKKRLESIPANFHIEINLKTATLIDHSVMKSLKEFKVDYENNGGKVDIIGLEKHNSLSHHDLASKVKRRLKNIS